MIWAAAHTTQFTKPGWTYLPVGTGAGSGAGLLANGGTYLTIADWTSGDADGAAADYTIVVEKMSSEHSSCVRPHLAPYPSAPEVAIFQLTGGLASIKTLYVWYTHWAYAEGDETVEFQSLAPIAVAADGTFSLNITVDSLYTLTTRSNGGKGVPSAPVATPFPFPKAWTDDFEACAESSEAAFFADQNGIFECKNSGDAAHGVVMQQQVPLKPVTWGGDIRPHSLVGHRDTFDASFVVDGYITEPGASVLVGVHMQGTDNSAGILLLFPANSNEWQLYGTIRDVNSSKPLATGATPVPILPGEWHTYRVDINGSILNVWVDGQVAASNANVSGMTTSGHFLIGCGEYGQYTQFDNVQLYSTFRDCAVATPAVGSPIVNSNCIAEVGPVPHTLWDFSNPPNNGVGVWNGTFSLRKFPTLCLASAPPDTTGTAWLVLATCNPADPAQQWTWAFEGISPDQERRSAIHNVAGCIDQYSQNNDIGAQLDAYKCSGAENQLFWYDWDEGMIGNEATGICLGVGPCQ